MPKDTFDKSGGGISLGNIPVAAPAVTAGTEGRVTVKAPDYFGNASDLTDNLVKGANQRAKAQEAARKGEAEDEAATAGLDTQFNFLSKDPVLQPLIQKAEEDGYSLTADDKDALGAYAAKQEFFRNAAAQGKSKEALALAQNRELRRIIASHPHLTPEILSVAGKVQDLGKSGVEAAFDREEEDAARKKMILDEQTKALVSDGTPDVEKMTPEEISVNFNKRIAPRVAAVKAAADEVALINADETRTNAEKKRAVGKLIREHSGDIANLTFASVARGLKEAKTPEEGALNIYGAATNAKVQLAEQTGLSPDEVEKNFGYIINPLTDLANKLNSKEITAQEAKNNLDFLKANADSNFLKSSPAVEKLTAVARNLPNTFPPQTQARIFADLARSGEAYYNGTGVAAPPDRYGSLPGNPADPSPEGRESQSTIAEHEKATSQFAFSQYSNPQLDEEQKAIITGQIVSGLIAPQGKDTEAGVYELIPSIADKKFLEFRKTANIPPEATKRVDDHIKKTLDSIDQVMNSPTGNFVNGQPERWSKYMDVKVEGENNDAKLVVHFLPGSEKFLRSDARALQARVDHLNQSVRARAHLSGTDQYGRVFQVIGELQ